MVVLSASQSMWAKFIRAKYAKHLHGENSSFYGSPKWRRMLKMRALAESQIAWVLWQWGGKLLV